MEVKRIFDLVQCLDENRDGGRSDTFVFKTEMTTYANTSRF